MNPIQSSSDHFGSIESVGGSEPDVSGSDYLVTPRIPLKARHRASD